MKKFILGISSDISTYLAEKWIEDNHEIIGTFRNKSNSLSRIKDKGARVFSLDLAGSPKEIYSNLNKHSNLINGWDFCLVSVGSLNPVGKFDEVNFDDWASSLEVNLINPCRILHDILKFRNNKNSICPTVIFFAGGAMNMATANFSAYSVSKMALTKIVELLQFEIPDVKFVIIGPGWVKTKIHSATLDAGKLAGENYERTKQRFASDDFVKMDEIFHLIEKVKKLSIEAVGGRNISVVHDDWQNDYFEQSLLDEPDLFKFRRKDLP